MDDDDDQRFEVGEYDYLTQEKNNEQDATNNQPPFADIFNVTTVNTRINNDPPLHPVYAPNVNPQVHNDDANAQHQVADEYIDLMQETVEPNTAAVATNNTNHGRGTNNNNNSNENAPVLCIHAYDHIMQQFTLLEQQFGQNNPQVNQIASQVLRFVLDLLASNE